MVEGNFLYFWLYFIADLYLNCDSTRSCLGKQGVCEASLTRPTCDDESIFVFGTSPQWRNNLQVLCVWGRTHLTALTNRNVQCRGVSHWTCFCFQVAFDEMRCVSNLTSVLKSSPSDCCWMPLSPKRKPEPWKYLRFVVFGLGVTFPAHVVCMKANIACTFQFC